MNIFNINTYLKKIIDQINDQYETIHNMDKKLNHHIQSTASILDTHTEKKDTNEYAKEVTNEKVDYIKQIDELIKEVSFHEGRSNKNYEEIKRLRQALDNISEEKRSFEKKSKLLEEELDKTKINPDEYLIKESQEKIIELENKINKLEANKIKLLKEIDFQKNRNKSNWDEIKNLKAECIRLSEENKKIIESNSLKEKDSKDLSCTINVPSKANGSYNLTIAGITKTRAEWRKEWGLQRKTLRKRIKKKWDNLEILFGKDFKYSDAKRFYIKYPDAILYDTLDDEIKNKLKSNCKLTNLDDTPSKDVYNNLKSKEESSYVEKLLNNDYSLSILKTIGETGLSRIAELKETVSFKKTFVTEDGYLNQGILIKNLKELHDLDVIDVEQINTGRKGGYENIYSLSDSGKELYKLIFSANPVESEKESIRRQHTSLEHGYFIKTVAREFANKGYKVDKIVDIKPENKTNKNIPLEADLIITKDDVSCIVICELGDISDNDLSYKLDKLINNTNKVSFTMNNQDSLNKTSTKVDKWITKRGRETLKGCTFRFTTLNTLKKKDVWQNKGPF